MVNEKLTNAFRTVRKAHWTSDAAFFGNRSFHRTAFAAVAKAREMVASDKAPTYTVCTFPTVANGNKIERAAEPGRDRVYFPADEFSRFQYSDEVIRLNHNGWFTAEDGWTGETYRGVAVQLPGSHGKPRYIGGYLESCNGGFVVDLTAVTDDPRVAASWGDSMAEHDAKNECDYQSAWSEGAACAMELESALQDIETALTRFRARRDAPLGSYWRKEARKLISAALQAARSRRDDALQTKDDNWHSEAFRDGFAN